MAIPMIGKTKREQAKAYEYRPKENAGSSSFVQVLDEAVSQQCEAAPTECHTITYGRDSRIQHFLYQTREYHY